MVAVVEVALKTFPDAATPGQAYRRALLDWLHNRQTDSKRGSLTRIEAGVTRIEAKIDTLFDYPSDLAEMVNALKRAEDAGFDWAAHGECVIEAIRERMQEGEW